MIEITDVVVVAVIIGLVQLVKQLAWIHEKYMPLLSVVLGIIAGVIYFEGEITVRIMFGIVLGLSAAGLFDQTKIVTKGEDK